MLLAKAEADAWWKKLMEGGEERGYYELLKEAVDAGELQRVDAAKQWVCRGAIACLVFGKSVCCAAWWGAS